jgi:hypothetical protein
MSLPCRVLFLEFFKNYFYFKMLLKLELGNIRSLKKKEGKWDAKGMLVWFSFLWEPYMLRRCWLIDISSLTN